MRLVEGADFALGKTQVLNRQIDERKRRRKVIAARMPRRDGVLEAALRIATLPVLAFQLLGEAIGSIGELRSWRDIALLRRRL